jgi:hypothetical protein
MISRARRTALDSAEKIDEWFGNRFTKTLPNVTAAADTALPFFDPSVKIFLYSWYVETSSLYLDK